MKGTMEDAAKIIDALSGAQPGDMVGSLWMPSPDGDFSVMRLLDAAKIFMETSAECDWTEDGDGRWESHCGHRYEFYADGPKENSFNHCPYCGLIVTEVRYKEKPCES